MLTNIIKLIESSGVSREIREIIKTAAISLMETNMFDFNPTQFSIPEKVLGFDLATTDNVISGKSDSWFADDEELTKIEKKLNNKPIAELVTRSNGSEARTPRYQTGGKMTMTTGSVPGGQTASASISKSK